MGDVFSNVMGTFTEKGLELVSIPTKDRCDVYKDIITTSQYEMSKSNITKKERKHWHRQQDKALEGLADVHQKNCDTVVKIVAIIGAVALVGCKILQKH